MVIAPIGVLGVVAWILMYPMTAWREQVNYWLPPSTCLKLTTLSIHTYCEGHREIPPRVSYDPDGNPLHSWRTLILPYAGANHVYTEIDLNSAWDLPANSIATSVNIEEFGSYLDEARPATTRIYAIDGGPTVWSTPHTDLADIPDGAGNTILLMEADLGAPWASPRDLTFDEAMDLLTGVTPWRAPEGREIEQRYFYRGPKRVLPIAMADGSVYRLTSPLNPQDARALLTPDGGETVNVESLKHTNWPQLDYGRIAVFTTFCLLSLAPARWAFARRVEGEA